MGHRFPGNSDGIGRRSIALDDSRSEPQRNRIEGVRVIKVRNAITVGINDLTEAQGAIYRHRDAVDYDINRAVGSCEGAYPAQVPAKLAVEILFRFLGDASGIRLET